MGFIIAAEKVLNFTRTCGREVSHFKKKREIGQSSLREAGSEVKENFNGG